MKYALAALVAVGLIGTTQAQTSGVMEDGEPLTDRLTTEQKEELDKAKERWSGQSSYDIQNIVLDSVQVKPVKPKKE